MSPHGLIDELKKMQKSLGLTDAALAAGAGVTPNDLRRIKSRPAEAKLGDLTALCEALGVEIKPVQPAGK